MGAYCLLARARYHTARPGEIMEVRALTTYPSGGVALFGDDDEVACIPHQGCSLEIVATAPSADRDVNLLLPGQTLRYRRSFFFGDRVELPGGRKVGFDRLVGFRLQLAPPASAPPDENAIVRSRRETATAAR